MCGRYAASADRDQLVEEFEIDEVADEPGPPNFNVAPTDPVAAVVERHRRDDDGNRTDQVVRKLVQLNWGLVPSWSKDAKGGARMINARFETVDSKPAFRKAFTSRRCLLPADGFYEWYVTEAPGPKPVKQPMFIHRSDGGTLVMAGLYEFWKSPEGQWLSTCSVITTTATDALGHIHDRMPMVIGADRWADWLNPDVTDPAQVRELLSVTEGDQLEAYAVSKLVNRVQNKGPELLEPLPVEDAPGADEGDNPLPLGEDR